MTRNRIVRARRLKSEEAAKYKVVQEQIKREMPELIARHHVRLVLRGKLRELPKQD